MSAVRHDTKLEKERERAYPTNHLTYHQTIGDVFDTTYFAVILYLILVLVHAKGHPKHMTLVGLFVWHYVSEHGEDLL